MNTSSIRTRQPASTAAHQLLALVCSVAATTAVQAQGWTQVSGGGNAGYFDTTVIDAPVFAGTPGPIDLHYWPAAEGHYAAASGAHQTLRAVAAGSSYGVHLDYGNQVNTNAGFSWVTPVNAGSSGLNVGDAITVFLDVRVDGKLAAGFLPYFTQPQMIVLPPEYHLTTWAAATLRYTLYDLDAPDYEGGNPDFSFDYLGSVNMEMSKFGPPYNSEYLQTSFYTQASAERHLSNFWNWAGNDSGISNASYGQVLDVDTGVLRFEIHTFVGHRLELGGELNVVANAFANSINGYDPLSWAAMADFGSTWDAELVSSVPGVEFGTLTAGVYSPSAVPEPASPALLRVGLAGMLGFLARRRAGRG